MKWTDEAQDEIKKVPFFVRKKVKSRVEEEARERGLSEVTLREVNRTRARFLNKMEKEVSGFQVEACFGSGGCPRKAKDSKPLQKKVEDFLTGENILDFLKAHVGEKLKFHHEFRVSFADCPNACSQPQIRDICIIGAVIPDFSEALCDGCQLCDAACAEGAIFFKEGLPVVDEEMCLACGQCIKACQSDAFSRGVSGYRVLLGGRLGRHPRLAMELPGIFDEETVFEIVRHCVGFWKSKSTKGERFSHLFTEEDFKEVAARFMGRSIASGVTA